jgi:Protein of unknown function with HXXEE motif
VLVLIQAAHSIEEYATKLYEVFPPARFLSGLLSDDHATGFLAGNVVLVAFALFCYAVPVRSGWPAARALAWFWVLLELGNGTGHLLLAASRGGYFPGAATAPFLLFASVWLALLLRRT